jgi:hypothetical protein
VPKRVISLVSISASRPGFGGVGPPRKPRRRRVIDLPVGFCSAPRETLDLDGVRFAATLDSAAELIALVRAEEDVREGIAERVPAALPAYRRDFGTSVSMMPSAGWSLCQDEAVSLQN